MSENQPYKIAKLSEIMQRPDFIWFRRYYVCVVVGLLLFFRTFWTPDILLVVGFSIFLLYGMGKEFLKRFLPFVVLLLAYESLRGFVPLIAHKVNYWPMINFDLWLGAGKLPTQYLQEFLYHGYLDWFDYYLYTLYVIHYFVPFVFAILIWRTKVSEYWRFVSSYLVLSFSAFLTYIAYPAAPPWLASQKGLISHIQHITVYIWQSWGVDNYSVVYNTISPNPVAAIPSLHSAYPMLAVLFVFRIYGWKFGVPAMIYPLSVWLGVVYLGEHYVIDVILGVIYAFVAYFVTNFVFDRIVDRKRAANIKNESAYNSES
jgi:membrane-associated phospholipid phosphatase